MPKPSRIYSIALFMTNPVIGKRPSLVERRRILDSKMKNTIILIKITYLTTEVHMMIFSPTMKLLDLSTCRSWMNMGSIGSFGTSLVFNIHLQGIKI